MSIDKIRVLIVDDSTFVRRALRRVMRGESDIEVVGEARDGLSAIQMARDLDPDVMTLDLQMPELSGLDVLKVISGELRTRVIMVSSFTREGAEETFRALEEGAFDFVDKTMVRNRLEFVRLGAELIDKVRMAAGSVQTGRPAPRPVPTPPPAIKKDTTRASVGERTVSLGPKSMILIGASTGGPPAVRRFLSRMRPTIEATIVIVQHMPPGFTTGFARRLNQISPVLVSEMRDGERLSAAHCYVIPSGFDATFRREGDAIIVRLQETEGTAQHRPSLDQTLRNVAELKGLPCAVVVLTGMGGDGAEGARALRVAGATFYLQDADSCVIHGMPKAVGAVVEPALIADPEQLGAAVVEWATRR